MRGSYLSKEKYSQNLRLEFFGQISDLELGTNRENFGIILNQHSHVFDDDWKSTWKKKFENLRSLDMFVGAKRSPMFLVLEIFFEKFFSRLQAKWGENQVSQQVK